MENVLKRRGVSLPHSNLKCGYKTLDEYHVYINDILLDRKEKLKSLLEEYDRDTFLL